MFSSKYMLRDYQMVKYSSVAWRERRESRRNPFDYGYTGFDFERYRLNFNLINSTPEMIFSFTFKKTLAKPSGISESVNRKRTFD